ncbi:MAG: C1 family peptidase, partial [Nitrososphaerota archaeon]
MLVIVSCIRRAEPRSDERPTDFHRSYGYRPLPEEFISWWFDNIENIKDGKADPIKFPKDSKLILNSSDIALTQLILSNPEVSSIPNSYLSPHTKPKDQGSNGTCWAFATAGSLESALLVQMTESERSSKYPFLDSQNPDISEQFIAYYNVSFSVESYTVSCQETNEDLGGNMFFSMYNLIRRGVPSESSFPYIKEEQGFIKWNPVGESWKTDLVRPIKTIYIRDYRYYKQLGKTRSEYINTIKSAIMKYGALAVAFMVYEDFPSYWSGNNGKVYIYHGGSGLGGHAILLVGWIDDYQDEINGYQGPIWILKNSWGIDTGFSLKDYGLETDTTKGYFALPMISEQEYNNENCPDWKIEYRFMTVPRLEVQNRPPNQPSNPDPADGAIDVSINPTLSWACSDPDGDSLVYDIYFGTDTIPPLVKSDHTSTSYNPETLNYSTTYYWKVVAKDGRGGVTEGPVWRFTTGAQPSGNLELLRKYLLQIGSAYGQVYSSPAVDSAGKIYIGVQGGYLIISSSNYQVLDSKSTSPVWSSPVVDSSIAYFSDRSGKLHVYPSKAEYAVSEYSIYSTPIIVGDSIYVVNLKGQILKINRSNFTYTVIANLNKEVRSSLVYVNSAIYVATVDGYIYSINPSTGSVNWSKAFSDNFYGGFAVDTSERLYIAGRSLKCIDSSNGNQIWSYPLDSQAYTNPVVSESGVIYIGDGSGTL